MLGELFPLDAYGLNFLRFMGAKFRAAQGICLVLHVQVSKKTWLW